MPVKILDCESEAYLKAIHLGQFLGNGTPLVMCGCCCDMVLSNDKPLAVGAVGFMNFGSVCKECGMTRWEAKNNPECISVNKFHKFKNFPKVLNVPLCSECLYTGATSMGSFIDIGRDVFEERAYGDPAKAKRFLREQGEFHFVYHSKRTTPDNEGVTLDTLDDYIQQALNKTT